MFSLGSFPGGYVKHIQWFGATFHLACQAFFYLFHAVPPSGEVTFCQAGNISNKRSQLLKVPPPHLLTHQIPQRCKFYSLKTLKPECALPDRPHPFSVTDIMHAGGAGARPSVRWLRGGASRKIPRRVAAHIYTVAGSWTGRGLVSYCLVRWKPSALNSLTCFICYQVRLSRLVCCWRVRGRRSDNKLIGLFTVGQQWCATMEQSYKYLLADSHSHSFLHLLLFIVVVTIFATITMNTCIASCSSCIWQLQLSWIHSALCDSSGFRVARSEGKKTAKQPLKSVSTANKISAHTPELKICSYQTIHTRVKFQWRCYHLGECAKVYLEK